MPIANRVKAVTASMTLLLFVFSAMTSASAELAWVDVSAAVRSAGDKRVITANITQSTRAGGGSIESAFDGKASSALTEALFSECIWGGSQLG